MNTPWALSSGPSAKRSRNKLTSASEDEGHMIKKMKPDCCNLSDLNRSRIYNFGYRKKPAELFRKDLISAMKMPDSEQLNRDDYLLITDSWREEWEKGVQVPVYPNSLPIANIRIFKEPKADGSFKLPKKLIKSEAETEGQSNYELDLFDIAWLEEINECESMPKITEAQLEDVINELEHQCARNMKAKQIGIEYDDHIICDVCRSPDGEEGNEMVFCDLCNICVHQACYGITEIPEGEWLCRPCKEYGSQKKVSCVLCPNLGGALKPTSTSNQWAHVSCALWVPEVSIGCVSTMEPITKIKQIPQTRWSLTCSLCNVKQGAPIQCSVKTCKTSYHVICAFNHKLKMKAIVDGENGKGVKLKSFCKKHSESENEVKKEQTDESKTTPFKHHEIEIATFNGEKSDDENRTEFWKYIDLNKIQHEIIKKHQKSNQSPTKIHQYIDFILQYWKLKRTSNYGASLIKLTSSAQFEEQQLQHRNDILRLRVDLERIRNLTYMICRREKIKRNWIKTHQSAIESSLSIFAGAPNPESTKVNYVYEESAKLVRDIVSTSVIYDYNKDLDKTRSSNIIKTLRRLSKIERIQRHKPNPYAKFYFTGIKRKDQQDDSLPTPINGISSKINCLVAKDKNNKPLNGLSSPHLSNFKSSTLNGIHSKSPNNINNPKISLNENKKSQMSYRQSPRSLLKPKAALENSNSSQNQTKLNSPITTRSSLIGYKIPKKRQEQSHANTGKEVDESIQSIKRKLDPQYFSTNRSPHKISSPNNTSPYRSEKMTNYCHSHHVQNNQRKFDGTKEHKSDKFFRSKRPQSILRQVTTRAQGHCDEAMLLASAVNDIDMRTHQSINFRHSLIH